MRPFGWLSDGGLSEAIETGGLEVHVRTDEMDALLAGIERLGNRVLESMLASTSIWGLVQLATHRRRRSPRLWRRRKAASANLREFMRRPPR